jgi:sec-independent protein translocase protein TatA
MFGLGMPEMVVIMGIAFLVFGGKKLPELGAGLGKGIKAFKTGLKDVEDTGKTMLEDNVPGLKEVNALKQEAKEVQNNITSAKG